MEQIVIADKGAIGMERFALFPAVLGWNSMACGRRNVWSAPGWGRASPYTAPKAAGRHYAAGCRPYRFLKAWEKWSWLG